MMCDEKPMPVDQLRGSSTVSFARSLFQAAEGKELLEQGFAFASAVSTYYSLFHLGGALILAHCSYPASTDDPHASIRNELERAWTRIQQSSSSNSGQYTLPDPAQSIRRHGVVPEFLKGELPQIAESLGGPGRPGTLRDMREFVSYAPRFLSNGLVSVLYSGCQYEPEDFRRHLRGHLDRIDEFFCKSAKWLAQKGYNEVHARILCGDFVLFEFAEFRSYHPQSIGRRAWASYCGLCEHEGTDWRAYRPDPNATTWHINEPEQRKRYEEIVQLFRSS